MKGAGVSFRDANIWTHMLSEVPYMVVVLAGPGIAAYDRDGATGCVLGHTTQLQPLEQHALAGWVPTSSHIGNAVKST